MDKLSREIAALDRQRLDLVQQRDEQRSRKLMSPYGCTGGDYWNKGELWFKCPDTQLINRLLFSSHNRVPYEYRDKYEHNAEKQFKYKYKKLFKEVTDLYKDVRLGMDAINRYVDEHHKKFNINIGY